MEPEHGKDSKWTTFKKLIKNVVSNCKEVVQSMKETNETRKEFSRLSVEFKSFQDDDDSVVETSLNSPAANVVHHLSSWSESARILAYDVLSHALVHTIGHELLYPGSSHLILHPLDSQLMEGRNELIKLHSAQRFKIETHDGNHIDSLFIDRRASPEANGRKLVICCEGNTDFYEIGIMRVPLKCGYSVLGWNAPGFGGSSGKPFPGQVTAAADAVVKLSILKLGFRASDILIYGWSIGGYPATWLAQKYQDIHGLILDATFDDVVHVALSQTNLKWAHSFIEHTMRKHFNLTNVDNLRMFKGPLLIIRRLKDMMMQTVMTDPIASNRGNELLIQVLTQRFPNLLSCSDVVNALKEYMSGSPDHQTKVKMKYQVDDSVCLDILLSYIKERGLTTYPVNIGSPEDLLSEMTKIQVTLFLTSKILVDFDAIHGDPLPMHLFVYPWDLFQKQQTSSKLQIGNNSTSTSTSSL